MTDEKKVLLVIAHEGFQPVEYSASRAAIESAGHAVLVASDGDGEANSTLDFLPAKIDINLKDAKAFDYHGVFIVGGPGALDHLDNEETYRLMRETKTAGILWGAICIAPRILARAGLLKGKKATGWDGDGKLAEIFSGAGAEYIREPVVVDGKLFTANGPKAAEEWGTAIVAHL